MDDSAGKRNENFVTIRFDVLTRKDLTVSEKLVYARICGFEEYYESKEKCSEVLGISPSTIVKAKNKLAKIGCIEEIGNSGHGKSYRPIYDNELKTEVRVSKSDNQTGKICHSDRQNLTTRQAKSDNIEESKKKVIKIGESKASGAKASKEDEERISVLYYKVIKELELPNSNNTVTRRKIKQMANEISLEQATWYLQFLLHHYEEWEHSYKPEINKALDIYEKRKAIIDKLKTGER